MTDTELNGLVLRMAQDRRDIIAAQELRYRVFVEDMGATVGDAQHMQRRDSDKFDDYCDHLLVCDNATIVEGRAKVIGTYRLLRRSVSMAKDGFYSASEFNLAPLSTYPGEIVELGRSCVDRAYRSKAVMQLLWRGIADYVQAHSISLMFGCASFPGTDLGEMASALSYLHHFHRAPKLWRPKALDDRYIAMKLLKKSQIDTRQALREMPPLIKGYLRVGGLIGDGAVIDHDFNTTDVCLLVETSNVAGRYKAHYLNDTVPETTQPSVMLEARS